MELFFDVVYVFAITQLSDSRPGSTGSPFADGLLRRSYTGPTGRFSPPPMLAPMFSSLMHSISGLAALAAAVVFAAGVYAEGHRAPGQS
jgi:hypothetical protein